jgi:N utilization substance protein B
MTATRRQAREWAIQMLTAADLNPSDSGRVAEDFWAQMKTLDDEDGGRGGEVPRGKLKEFADARVSGVLGELAEIDAVLEPILAEGGWDIYRLGTVERAVLRMGVWEMRHTDIPKAVVINEAIDLVNWFSSPKSRTLVNGVLDRYAKSL